MSDLILHHYDFSNFAEKALEAQHETRLLGEVREVVVMQDEVGHPAANFLRLSPDSR